MDPLLDEMNRAREVQPHSLRKWVAGLTLLIAAKDDKIAQLEARIAELSDPLTKGAKELAVSDALSAAKRGPGRPRKEDAHV